MAADSQALLILEDGTLWRGKAIGAIGKRQFGEIVFNTGLTGYQEIMTDPSYAEQIVTFTYPEIGNYGIRDGDDQSRAVFAAGMVVRNYYRGNGQLDDFLAGHDVGGIVGVDTRAITRAIRNQGAMRAVLSTETDVDTEALKLELASSQGMLGRELVSQVTAASPYELPASAEPRRGKIAAIDLGIKRNMIDLMRARGYDVRVLPATSSYADLIAAEPDGVFVSNGPGDPSACGDAINLIGQLIEASSIPVFGVCLGHQVLCLALGGSTYKLKFGHRGSNHPVQDLSSHRVLITSQNHGFAVDETSLAGNVIVTHRSLNDGTVEGFELQGRPIFGVQFHPEASPGPRDARDLFDRFAVSISEN